MKLGLEWHNTNCGFTNGHNYFVYATKIWGHQSFVLFICLMTFMFDSVPFAPVFHRAFLSGNLESNSRKREFQLNDLWFLESTRVLDKRSRVSTQVQLVSILLTLASGRFKLESSGVKFGPKRSTIIWNSCPEGLLESEYAWL